MDSHQNVSLVFVFMAKKKKSLYVYMYEPNSFNGRIIQFVLALFQTN